VDDREARELVGRVEERLAEVELLDEPARGTALAAVQALLDLYGEGLGRIVDGVAPAGGAGAPAPLLGDELVSHLLLLHDLHPVSVEERVAEALDQVRPYLASHGGDVTLLGIEGDTARLALQGSCSGCPASSMTLRLAVEDAIRRTAPEIERVEAEGVGEAPARIARAAGASAPGASPASDGTWSVAGTTAQLTRGGARVRDVAGEPVIFAAWDGDLYAYRPTCPACGGTLAWDGAGPELACEACANRYDARRAGRCVDDPQLFAEPIPLLTSETGVVRVALSTAAA
jgi:Fe-S cluster biogenesis protein NfuA/nitrite reductase/ring-hydroxylating ferredoxin subunit